MAEPTLVLPLIRRRYTDETIESDTPKDRVDFVNWLADRTIEMFKVDSVRDIVVAFPGPVRKKG